MCALVRFYLPGQRAQQMRLEGEALVLVLVAVIRAYPAGADIEIT